MRFLQGRWLAGVGLLVVVAVVVGAFEFGIWPFSGYAAVESPSGSGRIAFVSDRDGDDEIYVMNADGSGVEQLTFNDSVDGDPSWSPDGGRIVFVSDRDGDADVYDIYVMNADGSGVEQITDGCGNGAPVWSPDGDRIAFTSLGDVFVMYSDGTGVVQLTGNPHESCVSLFFSDRDGDGENELYVRKADGSVELFTDYGSMDWDSADWLPSWSADGERIVFQSHRDGDWDIYVMNADGSGVEPLTENDDVDWWPSLSPDGGRIAFAVSNLDVYYGEIYLMNMDGTGVERLTDNEHTDYWPAWSPDGGRIAFVSDRDGDWGIYVMNVDGIDVMNDGIFVKYDYIFVMNADGSEVERLDGSGAVRLEEGRSPAWSPLLE